MEVTMVDPAANGDDLTDTVSASVTLTEVEAAVPTPRDGTTILVVSFSISDDDDPGSGITVGAAQDDSGNWSADISDEGLTIGDNYTVTVVAVALKSGKVTASGTASVSGCPYVDSLENE